MSQAPTYTRATGFANDERDNVGGRATVRTAQVDAELDAISTSINALVANVALNQRDDGEIRDGRVKIPALASEVLALLISYGATPRGAWLTGTSYGLKDLVTQSTNTYMATTAHVGGTFATDLAAGKWILLALGTTPTATSVPFTPTATISASTIQAAVEEADTENRALSAAAQAAVVALAADLANKVSATKGAGQTGYAANLAYANDTVGKKLQEIRSAYDYGARGVSTVTDSAAIQTAAAVVAASGGVLVINSFVSASIDLSSLSLPTGLVLIDQRNSSSGWYYVHAEGEDMEFGIRGRASTEGEGPAFVGHNLSNTGNRNISFVHRYGPSNTVASFEHWGYNSDGTWYPGREWLGKGTIDTGFRARTRHNGNGTFVFNPNGDASSYKNNPAQGFVDGYIYTINAPLQTGYTYSGKYLFGLHVSKLDLGVELRVQDGKRIALQTGTGTTAVDRWGWLQDFPSAGQSTIYDYIAGVNKLVFTSGGDTSHTGVFKPSTDNTVSLGTSGNRWSVVYAGTGTINTSDEREKTPIEPLSAVHRRIALELKGKIGVFQFKDAVEAKGASARYHFGVGAQTVAAAFQAEGLDPAEYGLFCFDEWPAQPEVRGEDGEVIQAAMPAGNRYGIRYDELAMFIIAAL